jgi:hypothetical protein
MKPGNTSLSRYGTTIFETMSRLSAEKGALNLGQGVPEGDEPADIVAFAAESLQNGKPPALPPFRSAPFTVANPKPASLASASQNPTQCWTRRPCG